uniref:Alpha/beta hydrolase n=1 Tax=Thermogemmatispora argillosa TaxID=2045280 RepID=A0A455SUH1_9CHLR|nr:alpha/beta hydrolase [Thermogemmatispora argillosa]
MGSAWTEGDIEANAIHLHYSRTGDQQRPSILLLHGITDSGRCWSRVATDLATSYDVIMPDARGHGQSSLSPDVVSIALLATDAVAVIRALSLERPILIGHSMGAVTAAMVAASYPDLVRAIVLEDPPLLDSPDIPAPPSTWQWLFDLRTLSPEERLIKARALQPTWAEEEIGPWAASKAEVQIAVLDAAHAAIGAFPWRDVFPRIQCPMLLITGDPSLGAIVTAPVARQAVALTRQGQLVEIAGAGHNIHRDRYDQMMRAVKAFLSRVEYPGPPPEAAMPVPSP